MGKETRDRKKVSVVAIDFTLSDGQQELQKNARAFAEGVLRPGTGRIDRAADGWESFLAGREAYREMAHAGFTKSFIPAEYGGAGFSMLDLAIAAEELTCVDVNARVFVGYGHTGSLLDFSEILPVMPGDVNPVIAYKNEPVHLFDGPFLYR